LSANDRARRHYERRKAGLRVITVELIPDVAHARLVELGVLDLEDDFDPDVCLPMGIHRLLNGGSNA
jgi:hypothetical protein